jgi:hypothetical protein
MKAGHDLSWMQSQYGEVRGRHDWEAFCRANPLKGYCGLAGAPQ